MDLAAAVRSARDRIFAHCRDRTVPAVTEENVSYNLSNAARPRRSRDYRDRERQIVYKSDGSARSPAMGTPRQNDIDNDASRRDRTSHRTGPFASRTR